MTIPLTDELAWDFCPFYRLLGCAIVDTHARLQRHAGEHVYDMRIYSFTFPPGTQWLIQQDRHETLLLRGGICIDVRPFVGHSFLYLYVDYLVENDVLLPITKGGAN